MILTLNKTVDIVATIKQCFQLEKTLSLIIKQSVKLAIPKQLIQIMEELPIVWNDVHEKGIMFFILVGNEWFPCHVGTIDETIGWLNYRINYKDGSTENGISRPFHWAHCTADNSVNYHWLEEA